MSHARTVFLSFLWLLSAEPSVGRTDDAEEVLKASGVRGGLIVHIGSGDQALSVALAANDSCVVQALERSPDRVQKAREYIQGRGLYGNVSVYCWKGDVLPYVDNLVNLLVVSDEKAGVAREEILRVLVPGGVAMIQSSAASSSSSDRRVPSDWKKIVKSIPDGIDQWTHWMHDASGNGVARDRLVGPPRHYQWLARPYWSKHHDTVLNTSAMVSAGGRLFYIGNEEKPSCVFSDAYDGQWFLVARDAFNGTLLWKIPIAGWGWKTWGQKFHDRFAQPVQLPSRLVAVGDTVYVTLGYHQPVTAIDAPTGKILKTYENSQYADEILYHQGQLILSTYTPEDLKTLKMNRSSSRRPAASPPASLPKTVRVLQSQSGALLWERGPFLGVPARYDVLQGYDGLGLTAHQDRIVLVTRDAICCLDLQSGKTRWQKTRPARDEYKMTLGVRQSENCTLLSANDIVLFTQPRGNKPHTNHTNPCDVYALDAASGDLLWSRGCGVAAWGHPADVFVIGDLVWIHNHDPGPQPWQGPEIPSDILPKLDYCLLGLDLRTGEVKKKIPTRDIFQIGHHHRCYRNKATENYVLTARRGTELTDLANGKTWIQHWLRSECRYGNLPANGLLYSAPHPCGCYMAVALKGYNALASSNARAASDDRQVPDGERLVCGPAYGGSGQKAANSLEGASPPSADQPTMLRMVPVGARLPSSDEWPTYRGDAARSGHVRTKLPAELKPLWKAPIGGTLSSLTVAGGQCYVSSIDAHTVHALDAARGHRLWSYTAGARIDSPPTLCGDQVLFGSADGWVYCLRAADGALIWRFLAAPHERLMMADSQLESVWPVHGSVLVREGEVCFMAGRSSYLDGGITAYRLAAANGALLEKKQLYSADPKSDKQPTGDTFTLAGCQSHVLVSDGRSVYQLNNLLFGDGKFTRPYLAATADFLDDTLFVRTWWSLVGAGQAYGSMLVHDDRFIFGFRPFPTVARTQLYVVGTGYPLFCVSLDEAQDKAAESFTANGYQLMRPRKLRNTWDAKVNILVQAMVLTDDALLVAGPPDVADPADPYAAFEGRKGGKLLVLSRQRGATLSELPLESPPVWDGMAAAGQRVYVSGTNGKVICLGQQTPAK